MPESVIKLNRSGARARDSRAERFGNRDSFGYPDLSHARQTSSADLHSINEKLQLHHPTVGGPAIPAWKDSGIAILLVTFLLKKSDKQKTLKALISKLFFKKISIEDY